jgi:hypothetical protein
MEATPALRNNWDFATAPSPESVLMAGLQPIQDAVSSYNQRAFEAGQASVQRNFEAGQAAAQRNFEAAQAKVAADRAEKLMQLHMQLAFQNVSDRDKTLLQWHAAQDAERLKQYTQVAQQRSDAAAKLESIKYAQARDLPVIPQGQGVSDADYTDQQNKANTANYATWKKGNVPFIKEQLNGLGQVRNDVNNIKQQVSQQASAAIPALIPNFVALQDPNDPGVVAYTNGIKRGLSPVDAMKASATVSRGLAASWNAYAQEQNGNLQTEIMDKKGYRADLQYLELQQQQYGNRISEFIKTHPYATDVITDASQSISDDALAKAKKDRDAADAGRASGNTDPQTQAQLDAQAAKTGDVAAKLLAAHKQLQVTLGQNLGGQPIDNTPTVSSAAMTKEEALANLGLHIDANNQLQRSWFSHGTVIPTATDNPNNLANPDPRDLYNLAVAQKIIASPTLPWKYPRPGLPGIQPGQRSPAALLTPRAAVPVQPASQPTNSLAMPFTINDLYQSGILQQPAAVQAPATAAAPVVDTSGLVLPPIPTPTADDTAAALEQQGNWMATQQLMGQ